MKPARLALCLPLVLACAAAPAEVGDAAGGGDLGAPAAGWRRGAAAPEARTEVAAALLRGRIYLVGGLAAAGGSRRVDLYDPQADAWQAGPPLPEAAPRHHLALASDGERLYVLGGFIGSGFTPTARSWILDGDSWREGAPQPLPRGAATAQALGGLIYVAGGALDGGKPTGELYRYDPKGNGWQRRAPMKVPREHLASCAFDGRLVVAGGRAAGGNLGAAEGYDAARDEWSPLPDLPTARSGLSAAALGDTCYVLGGERLDGQPPGTFAENEGFSLSTGAWRALPPLPSRRHGLAAVAAGGSLYVLLGGPQPGFTYSPLVEIFTP